ncbi:MAG: hypothetical protein ACJAWL_003491 [Motiliproteus sp.]|jgi:hypothetical protein
MHLTPIITVIHDLSRATKALFIDQQLVLQSDPTQDDPLYLIDEAAEQLAAIHRVLVRQQVRH